MDKFLGVEEIVLRKLLTLPKGGLDDLEAADIGQEVAYRLVGGRLVGPGLDGGEAIVRAIAALGSTIGAVGVAVFCRRTHF